VVRVIAENLTRGFKGLIASFNVLEGQAGIGRRDPMNGSSIAKYPFPRRPDSCAVVKDTYLIFLEVTFFFGVLFRQTVFCVNLY
jgi:hypothetical protein